jgi:uncharacterized membrane protein
MGQSLREKYRSEQGERPTLTWIAGGLLLLALATYVLLTPPGLLNKARMTGYAVCHQIPSHSFSLGGHQLPLCARCTGTFLGALVGLVGQAVVLRRRRAAAFPPTGILVVLIAFTLLWAGDGLNSYLALIGAPHAYEPANELRLITGALNGLTMSALIYPIFNISIWRRIADSPAVRGLRDLGVLLLFEAALVGVVLSGERLLLYPLALLSAAAVVTLLASVNTVLAVVLLGRENEARTWREAVFPIATGVLLSLVQIGVIDLIRYLATGTLGPIPLLQ